MEQLLSATLLLVVLIALRYLLRGRINLGLQYALWFLAAVRLLVPISLGSSPLSVQNLTSHGNSTAAHASPMAVPPVNDGKNAAAPSPQSPLPEGGGAGQPAAPPGGHGEKTSQPEAVSHAVSPQQILSRIWLTGTVIVSLWFLLQNVWLYGRLRRNRTRLDLSQTKRRVYLTDRLPSPCLFGLIRPAIYLTPSCLKNASSLPYILAHEETHYRHLDYLWSFVRCLCLAIYWFHPLVWWAAALSRTDCELACDQGALSRLGEEHRRDYGLTLLSLALSKGTPADLLCGATTMTGSKAKLKERIVMLTHQPKMFVSTLCIVALILSLTVGCTFTGSQPQEEAVPLSAEELSYFNGNDFFNGEYFNLHNQFLSSLYEKPQDIDLFELFYARPNSEGISEAELQAVSEKTGWSPDTCPCGKISKADLDAALTENMGLTLADTNGVGLDSFTYLEEYDAYYNPHGDTNYRSEVSFYAGEQQGDLVRLYYEDTFMADGCKAVTLKKVDGGYHFVSHQYADTTRIGSIVHPDGVVTAGLDVPPSVLTATKGFVQDQYAYRLYNTGITQLVDGVDQMVGELPVIDNWRIEGLARVQTISLQDSLSLEIYRVDYRIHTTTPEKVVLAGGMDMDQDGWWLDTYPGCTYLVFTAQGREAPVYQFDTMLNDCNPGEIFFTCNIISQYEDQLAHTSEMTQAPMEAYQFFASFADGKYEPMREYCTPSCLETYFHDGDVFGMETAELIGLRPVDKNSPEGASLAENEDALFVTVSMKAAPTSALYDPRQETQNTSFYVIFQLQNGGENDGAILIDRFVTGL